MIEVLADAIANVAGVKAETVDVKVGDPNIKKVVCFSTAAILKSTYAQVSKLFAQKNIAVDSREFHCRGSFTIMHKGHPNSEDIAAVETFTKDVLKG